MRLNQKPWIGILAFIVVLFVMPLGHTLMILIEHLFGDKHQFTNAGILGLVGVVLLIIGMKNQNENAGTWLGFFAGIFLWTGWIEFSFVFYAKNLAIAHLVENGKIVTKAEYLLMPSSIGLLFSTLPFFFLNSQSGCRFFIWIRKLFKMPVSLPDNRKRNFAAITAMETIYIIWAFYLLLLISYDKNFFGDHHLFTYLVFFGCLIWSFFLLSRLIKFTRMSTAIRYAIPTVIIFWNSIEILGRWNFFKEIWIYPAQHSLEMLLIFFAFLSIMILSLITPRLKSRYVNQDS